jgi:hypothetical protein
LCDTPLADGEECELGDDACTVDQCQSGVCTETTITLPPEECGEGLKIFGCRLIDGVKYIRPLLAERSQFLTRIPGRPFLQWGLRGELVIPGGLPDVDFDPDSQVTKLILSQDTVIYPPGNIDDPDPLLAGGTGSAVAGAAHAADDPHRQRLLHSGALVPPAERRHGDEVLVASGGRDRPRALIDRGRRGEPPRVSPACGALAGAPPAIVMGAHDERP